MAIDLQDGYHDLLRHAGHAVHIVTYGAGNVVLECTWCHEILLDFEVPPRVVPLGRILRFEYRWNLDTERLEFRTLSGWQESRYSDDLRAGVYEPHAPENQGVFQAVGRQLRDLMVAARVQYLK